MSIIYVDAAKPPVSAWHRRVIATRIIRLTVTLTNTTLFLTLDLVRATGYPLPRPAIALLTRGKLHAGHTVRFSAAGSQGRELASI